MLVDAVRADGDAAFELVADEDSVLAGYVLLSAMEAPFRALGLAPLAVNPHRQRRGVGGTLVRAAVAAARADGWDGIFLFGEPDYYGRFGFSVDAARGFASPYAGPHFQLLRLSDRPLPTEGPVAYAPAFARL